MKKSVYALVVNEEQARRIVNRLMSSNFSNEDISIVSPDRNRGTTARAGEYDENLRSEAPIRRNLSIEKHTKAPEGAATGATAGGILGGTLGLLAGVGALAIPGLGPFIAAGPILAALSGSAVGGGLGLLVGALVGSGIPEYEAKRYESGLKEGNILISVQFENEQELNRATEILRNEGAKDISTSREKIRSGY